ncbi:hypothetical protein NKJ26_27835, partial [Mesorhizobium sp. M0152]|uniref:hypothetical protein n=1 Tax=Mesorhizobium sp. M0152 TaxID=2956898 RepID=UPI0033394085
RLYPLKVYDMHAISEGGGPPAQRVRALGACQAFSSRPFRVPVVSSLPHRRSENSLHMLCEVEFAERLDL